MSLTLRLSFPRFILSVFPTHSLCFFSDDFVLMRLKKEAVEEGPFLVRWSVIDYHCIILVVLNRSQVSLECTRTVRTVI